MGTAKGRAYGLSGVRVKGSSSKFGAKKSVSRHPNYTKRSQLTSSHVPRINADNDVAPFASDDQEISSSPLLNALQPHHNQRAGDCRSANAYLSACPETRPSCSGSLLIAFEFSAPSQGRDNGAIPVGLRRRVHSICDMRRGDRHHKVCSHADHNIHRLHTLSIRNRAFLHLKGKVSIQSALAARHHSNPPHKYGFCISRSRIDAGIR